MKKLALSLALLITLPIVAMDTFYSYDFNNQNSSSKEEKPGLTDYCHIKDLPKELIGEIVNFLNLNDSYSTSLTCKKFLEIIKSLNNEKFNLEEKKAINKCLLISKLGLLPYEEQKKHDLVSLILDVEQIRYEFKRRYTDKPLAIELKKHLTNSILPDICKADASKFNTTELKQIQEYLEKLRKEVKNQRPAFIDYRDLFPLASKLTNTELLNYLGHLMSQYAAATTGVRKHFSVIDNDTNREIRYSYNTDPSCRRIAKPKKKTNCAIQ